MATDRSRQKFCEAAKDYLNDEQFSDFTIVCEDKVFKVHRCFISAHSPFFKQCCSGVFAETKNSSVELKEDLKEVVERMITYFYTFDYDDAVTTDPKPKVNSGRPATPIQMNAHVYALADKYQVDELKALAVEKIKKSADVSSKGPHGDRVLHEIIINMWLVGAGDWLHDDGLKVVQAFCKDVPDFGSAMFVTLARGTKQGTVRFTCSKCKKPEIVPRSQAITHEYRCKNVNCQSTEAASGVTIQGPVAFEKFW